VKNNNSEHFFADLCGYAYLSAFTFHSPKIYDPTEKEVGDILIWVRTQLIVFELIWRAENKESTKSFIKRIGEKREQLLKDFHVFQSKKNVHMVNKSGRKIEYKPDYFVPSNFFGLVIIDCESKLEKIHYGTLLKVMESPFPMAVMTKSDFQSILNEVDTSSDLKFYLRDRFTFFKKVYEKSADFFLDLNKAREKQLIAFYKINNYAFPVHNWDPERDYWSDFHRDYYSQIKKRDQENDESMIIDGLINSIMETGGVELPLVHAWQLAVIPRRARAGMFAKKIIDALEKMKNGKAQRHFAIHNSMTNCWLVFYFQYGGIRENLIKEIEKLSKLKLIYEISERGFSDSVIGYGFRKSEIITGNKVDDIVLVIEDAENYKSVPSALLSEAKKFFKGATSSHRIRELPN
jgi:hypothetical protein